MLPGFLYGMRSLIGDFQEINVDAKRLAVGYHRAKAARWAALPTCSDCRTENTERGRIQKIFALQPLGTKNLLTSFN